nr:MAG TPA: hypothetical protein [Caudoviricetes sp.]
MIERKTSVPRIGKFKYSYMPTLHNVTFIIYFEKHNFFKYKILFGSSSTSMFLS